jgi:hypothetical protein
MRSEGSRRSFFVDLLTTAVAGLSVVAGVLAMGAAVESCGDTTTKYGGPSDSGHERPMVKYGG